MEPAETTRDSTCVGRVDPSDVVRFDEWLSVSKRRMSDRSPACRAIRVDRSDLGNRFNSTLIGQHLS